MCPERDSHRSPNRARSYLLSWSRVKSHRRLFSLTACDTLLPRHWADAEHVEVVEIERLMQAQVRIANVAPAKDDGLVIRFSLVMPKLVRVSWRIEPQFIYVRGSIEKTTLRDDGVPTAIASLPCDQDHGSKPRQN